MCDHQSTREVTLIFVGELIVPERLGDTQEIIQYICISNSKEKNIVSLLDSKAQ
jgi:hypothetical protein